MLRPLEKTQFSATEIMRHNLRRYVYMRYEAGVIVEGWRQHYNTHRPHSALGYRPPAPETRTFAPISVSA